MYRSTELLGTNLHGRYTDTRMGDAFSSYCDDGAGSGSGSDGCARNPSWRNPATSGRGGGYLYGIEANDGNAFGIQFLDIVHHNTSDGVTTSDSFRTGDRGCEQWGDSSPTCGQTVRTRLFAPDPSPLNIKDNVLLCEKSWPPKPQVAANEPYTWENTWCTQDSPVDGVYVPQVKVADPNDASDAGLNRYSVRATGGASLYGIGDMSLYNNASGTISEFFLAQVSGIYSGKDFIIELYDPGEANPGDWVEVKAPDGPGAWTSHDSCIMTVRSSQSEAWGSPTTLSPCRFFANNDGGSNDYNGDWIQLQMSLSGYACGNDCWWKLNYDYPNNVPDTTTWTAYIVGSPVHLLK